MITDLLNTEITDLATLESLPLGAIVICGEAPWQRIINGNWYIAGSASGTPSAKLIRHKPPLVVWLPSDAAGYETDATPQPRDSEHGTCVCGGGIRYFTCHKGHWIHDEYPADGHDAVLGGPA